jgi:aryl-alcohol dehydrogenase-like predicted oxidoreductase
MVSNEAMCEYWDHAELDDLLDGLSRVAFLLRFTLSHPALDTTIVGTGSVEHLRANVTAAAQGPLPPDVIAEVKQRLSAAGARPTSA